MASSMAKQRGSERPGSVTGGEALARIYAEAAADPLFTADNAAVQRDFAALDREADQGAGG
jgi:hypothetical protein